MANNGSGFLPAAVLQENVKLPEIPPPETPVFDELITKVSNEGSVGARHPQSTLQRISRNNPNFIDYEIYREYVKKLKATYPTCKLGGRSQSGINIGSDITPLTSGMTGPVAQSFESSKGYTYYRAFEDTEKRCFLQPFVEARQKAEAEQEKIKKQKKIANNYEKRRLAKVPMGNLLGLNKSPEPNLLGFGPTKNGLNARAKELEGLFGGRRKTRRARKHRRRSTHRKH